MATQIQLRRDLAANWTSENPVLASGEVGFETDENRFKIGDGSTDYANLAYAVDAELGNVLSNVNIVESESNAGLILSSQNNNNMEFKLDGSGSGSTMQLSSSALNIFADLNCGEVNTSSLQSGSESNLSINATDGQLQLSAADGTLINGTTIVQGKVAARQYAGIPSVQGGLSGNIVLDHTTSGYQVFSLSGDFAITDIEGLLTADFGIMQFIVPANADVSYDDVNFEAGNFQYLNGDRAAFANAMPQGGTETYDRWWQVRYSRPIVNVGGVNQPVLLEMPTGPYHVTQ